MRFVDPFAILACRMQTFLQSPPGVSEAGGPLRNSSSTCIPASPLAHPRLEASEGSRNLLLGESREMDRARAADDPEGRVDDDPAMSSSAIELSSNGRSGLPGGPRLCEMDWAIEADEAAE